MATGTDQYGARFFAEIRDGCQRSARAAVPIIVEQLGHVPERVVDVGGGEGWWAEAFQQAGTAFPLVVDGSDHDVAVPLLVVDLTQPFELEPHDLAVCLEVAEHLPPDRAEGFVADLVKAAPIVLFSAAMPGQGGTGHINCQPPQYWAALFDQVGYACSGALRWPLWHEEEIEPWYRSNLLLFVERNAREVDVVRHLLASPLFDAGMHTEPLHVVAPDLWISLPAGR